MNRRLALVAIVVVLLAFPGGTAAGSSRFLAPRASVSTMPVGVTPATRSCSVSLILVLRPGHNWPGSVKSPTPSDLPPGDVTVKLPLYSGAQVATEIQKHPNNPYEANLYVKSTFVDYQTEDPLATVITWYRSAFAACGYVLKIQGESSDHGAVVANGLVWTKPAARDEFWMSLSFASSSTRGTLIRYVAIDYTPPVYPAPGSILRVPGRPVKLTITRYSGLNPGFGALRPLRVATVTRAGTIRSLAQEINKLPKLTAESYSCPLDDGSHLTLVFTDADGSQHVVTVEERGCQFVTAPPAPSGWLYDDQNLLPRLLALVSGPDSRKAPYYYEARSLRPVAVRPLATSDSRFLSTGQSGQHVLYLAHGDLFVAPAAGGQSRQLARGIDDASFGIDDFVVVAHRVHAAPRSFIVINTRTGHVHALTLPASAALIGRNAGRGRAGLGDALEYALEQLWYIDGQQIGGVDPEHRGDTSRTAPFLPAPTPGELLAISCSGDLVAVAEPGVGIDIYSLWGNPYGRQQLVRHLSPTTVSFLSWAPDDIHLAYRSENRLMIANVRSGRARALLSLRGQTVNGAAWDPWSHVLALSLAPTGQPATQSRVKLVDADGTGAGSLPLPFRGATELGWSSFRGETIGVTQASAHGTEAWELSLPTIPTDPGKQE